MLLISWFGLGIWRLLVVFLVILVLWVCFISSVWIRMWFGLLCLLYVIELVCVLGVAALIFFVGWLVVICCLV